MLKTKSKQERKTGARPSPIAIRDELRRIMAEMDCARNHFDQAVDPVLIDCYIYEINAAQLRYQFLLRRIKNQE